MKKCSLFIMVLLMVGLPMSFAATEICDDLLNSFRDRNSCFVEGHCVDTAYELAQHFKEKNPHVDLSNARILFVHPRGPLVPGGFVSWKPEFKITPKIKRASMQLNQWTLHTVIEFNGLIYDFQYVPDVQNGDNPVPVSIPLLFKNMFNAHWSLEGNQLVYHEEGTFNGPIADNEIAIYVRSYPLLKYLEKHKSALPDKHNLNPNGTMTYREWLLNQDPEIQQISLKDFLRPFGAVSSNVVP